jgi:hypothetical protein
MLSDCIHTCKRPNVWGWNRNPSGCFHVSQTYWHLEVDRPDRWVAASKRRYATSTSVVARGVSHLRCGQIFESRQHQISDHISLAPRRRAIFTSSQITSTSTTRKRTRTHRNRRLTATPHRRTVAQPNQNPHRRRRRTTHPPCLSQIVGSTRRSTRRWRASSW